MGKPLPPPPAAHDQPPPELLVPVVEVFCTAAELGSMDDDALLVLARRRWRDARDAWLAEHGVALRDQGTVWPSSRPRFAPYDEPT